MLRKIIMICCCALVPKSRQWQWHRQWRKVGCKKKKLSPKSKIGLNVFKFLVFFFRPVFLENAYHKSGNEQQFSIWLKLYVAREFVFFSQTDGIFEFKWKNHSCLLLVWVRCKSRLLFQNNFHIWKNHLNDMNKMSVCTTHFIHIFLSVSVSICSGTLSVYTCVKRVHTFQKQDKWWSEMKIHLMWYCYSKMCLRNAKPYGKHWKIYAKTCDISDEYHK